ncbi:MAG TPA: polysaccharide biosynthesis/export family protein, partial [Candidatus Obscuribacterales bacterium]
MLLALAKDTRQKKAEGKSQKAESRRTGLRNQRRYAKPGAGGDRWVRLTPLAQRWLLAVAIVGLAAVPTQANPAVSDADAFPSEADALPLAPSLPPDNLPVLPPSSAPIAEDYRLGAGDIIDLKIFNLPEHSGNQQILVDGSVSLEWVGNVQLAGLTLEAAATAIATAYGRYLRNPNITVSLVTPRPLQVSVAGAVNRPGAYQVDFGGAEGDGEATGDRLWPTVTQVLQQAGGITQLADVRQVEVRREIGPGQTQTLNIDLWELLVSGDLRQDVTLRDGDTIVVPQVQQISTNEARQLAIASFSPTTVRVNVVGEVTAPGVIEVPPNTPLNQAILAAGGFDNRRAQTGSVDL